MHPKRLIREIAALVVLAGLIFTPASLVRGQTQAVIPNPLADLTSALKATPGVLGIETARTSSGKQVIFAWFENRKAALAWYYSDTHQALMKMSGFPGRPGGPLASVPDDGRPIMAIASLTPSPQGTSVNGLPPITQIAIELYAPLPGGVAAGGRFAPMTLVVPGLIDAPLVAGPPKTN
jgi:hypothetical protein